MKSNIDKNSGQSPSPLNSDGNFESAIGHMASSAHEAVDKFASQSNGFAKDLQAKGEQFNEVQERWLEPVRCYIQQNPMTSLSIAVAGGYMVSRLLSSR